MDLALKIGNADMINILKNPGFLTYLGINPPNRPIGNTRVLQGLFASLLFIGFAINFYLGWQADFDLIYLVAISGLQILSFILVSIKDPGYLYKN